MLLSPLAVILLGHLTARAATAIHPSAAWVAVALAYWGAMAVVIALSARREDRRAWWAPSARRPWWVIPAALALGVFPIAGILLLNLHIVAAHAALIAPWLVFAAVNPVMEEAYWRGALADATSRWPAWVACAYTTVLFVASHPLMWGVFSEGNRSPMLYGSLVLMGAAWFAMRRVTGTLRWATVSHVLVDIGNLSVFVFVNAYVPPAIHG
ncbi:type II CAAX prenyl endopeptidase Rce1 family protein [Microbacterium sp. Marseille-Q6965]|uniref:CPBP family glutamic-type intramembrane protease n=1 Tax=Microbacterium sp. Marseille-Q6965 TaxID=2965072 RepID=UPI0021B79186|nr:CPBP family glutamic-type intramembrane protease [Microbacterium sp. Marseille-Q6965]